MTLLEQNHIYLRINSESTNPILKKILCYPHFANDIFSERLDELQSLQIDYFELQGPTVIDGIHLLGKGTRGIVVKASSNNSSFALKIRRTDSPRLDLINEAKIQTIVNQFGIAPKIFNSTKNFISMEFIDGFILNDYIHKFQNNFYQSEIEASNDTWYNATAVFTDGNVKLYIDGVLELDQSFSQQSNDNVSGMYFGRYTQDGNLYFANVVISHAAIWDRALSIEEIQNGFNSELSGDEDGLVGLWKFNAGEGEILYDHTGNANHGTISGASWSDDVPSFQPQTTAELQTAVDLWVSDNATALETYGEINTWDVSLITDMSSLFSDKSTFNDDISSWDVSSVTNMWGMFYEATSFNGDISTWDVSYLINMGRMFRGATSFNQDLSGWNTSNVTEMGSVFYK